MGDRPAFINFGPKGVFAPGGELTTTPENVDALVAELSTLPNRRLVLHFFDGLTPSATQHQIGERLSHTYNDPHLVPITAIWGGGLAKTFQENLTHVHETEIFKKLIGWIVEKAAGFFSGGTGARGGGAIGHEEVESALANPVMFAKLQTLLTETDAPISKGGGGGATEEDLDEDQLRDRLEIDLRGDSELRDLLESDATGTEPLRKATGAQEGVQESARGAVFYAIAVFVTKVVIASVKRRFNRTDHDLLPTAVEELLRAAYMADLGKWLWDDVKSVAKTTWQAGVAPHTEHVGHALLQGLEVAQKKRSDLSIDLVAHSSGAIAVCHMLNAIAAQNRDIRFRSIVFLAPSCRLELLAEAMVRRPPSTTQFRLFSMRDEDEKADEFVTLLYPRSWLYLVSGVLEDIADAPLAGLERHINGLSATAGEEFDDVRRWLAAEDRLVYCPTAPGSSPGRISAARSHQAFLTDRQTLDSLAAIANG